MLCLRLVARSSRGGHDSLLLELLLVMVPILLSPSYFESCKFDFLAAEGIFLRQLLEI